MQFTAYDTAGFFDEMFEVDGCPRAGAALLVQRIHGLPAGELLRRPRAAEQALLQMGITFNVYGDAAGTERIFPFDVIPRIVEASDWALIERGLKQRIQALNLFIDDIYQAQHIINEEIEGLNTLLQALNLFIDDMLGLVDIINDGIVPPFLIQSAKCFLQPCVGLRPPRGIWCHITGTDLVRDRDGQIY